MKYYTLFKLKILRIVEKFFKNHCANILIKLDLHKSSLGCMGKQITIYHPKRRYLNKKKKTKIEDNCLSE
jgi:hypothetical protein